MPELAQLTAVMQGKPTRLESRFRITYAMILNLLRARELGIEEMLRRSFSEFGALREVETNKVKLMSTGPKRGEETVLLLH